MNKEYWKMVARRFAKGLGSALLAFLITFGLALIPELSVQAKEVIKDPLTLSLITAVLLALEKSLQGWKTE